MAQDAEKTIDQLNDEADIAADYLEGLLDREFGSTPTLSRTSLL